MLNVINGMAREFEGAMLGDARRARRLVKIATDIAQDPSASLPDAAGSDAALEACYRFLNSEAVTAEDILAPHRRCTEARAKDVETLLVVHDTSSIELRGDDAVEGLGPLRHKNGKRGFFAHVSLAVSLAEHADPLGVVAVSTYVRKPHRVTSRRTKTLDHPENETTRWRSGVDESQAVLASARPIHVMDREADVYELLHHFIKRGQRFVVRSQDDRATIEPIAGTRRHVRISSMLAPQVSIAARTITLSRRREPELPVARRMHPGRGEREARVSIRATNVEILRSTSLPTSLPPSLRIGVVEVVELDPPPGAEPVHWRLLTSEAISTAEHVERVVDMYRARWRIEELFKALKTGCAFERRGFRSYAAFRRALAVFLPVAWRMLRLRALSRSLEERPATDVLSPTQLAVLRATSRRVPLSATPSAKDVLLAVAGLGGHLKRNGAPGWQTLGRGLDKLLFFELGWQAAMEEKL